jgi:hypothetical protein
MYKTNERTSGQTALFGNETKMPLSSDLIDQSRFDQAAGATAVGLRRSGLIALTSGIQIGSALHEEKRLLMS